MDDDVYIGDSEPAEAVYVTVFVLSDPVVDSEDANYYHIPVAVEHTPGLPLAYVVSLLERAAESLKGGEVVVG